MDERIQSDRQAGPLDATPEDDELYEEAKQTIAYSKGIVRRAIFIACIATTVVFAAGTAVGTWYARHMQQVNKPQEDLKEWDRQIRYILGQLENMDDPQLFPFIAAEDRCQWLIDYQSDLRALERMYEGRIDADRLQKDVREVTKKIVDMRNWR